MKNNITKMTTAALIAALTATSLTGCSRSKGAKGGSQTIEEADTESVLDSEAASDALTDEAAIEDKSALMMDLFGETDDEQVGEGDEEDEQEKKSDLKNDQSGDDSASDHVSGIKAMRSLMSGAANNLTDYIDEDVTIDVHGTDTIATAGVKNSYEFSYAANDVTLQQVGDYAVLKGTNDVYDQDTHYRDTVLGYFMPTTIDDQTLLYINDKGMWMQFTTGKAISEKEFLRKVLNPSAYARLTQETDADNPDIVSVSGEMDAKDAVPILSHSISCADLLFSRAFYLSDAIGAQKYTFTMSFDKNSKKMTKLAISGSGVSAEDTARNSSIDRFEIEITPVSSTEAPKTEDLMPTKDIYQYADQNLIVASGDYTIQYDGDAQGKSQADINAADYESMTAAEKTQTKTGEKTLYQRSQEALNRVESESVDTDE